MVLTFEERKGRAVCWDAMVVILVVIVVSYYCEMVEVVKLEEVPWLTLLLLKSLIWGNRSRERRSRFSPHLNLPLSMTVIGALKETIGTKVNVKEGT